MAAEILKEVSAKIRSVRERRMRAFLLGEYMMTLDGNVSSDMLAQAVDMAARGSLHYGEILFSFVDLLESIFDLESEKHVASVVRKLHGAPATLKLLALPPHPHKFLKRGEVHITDIMMDYLPLGVKRSYAKKLDRMLIRRMVLEKDPHVIRHLLSNPIVIEKDVLKIASNRPTTPEVLKVVYSFDKWIQFYAVKEALIKNPYAPFRIALLLLFFMKRQDLDAICADMTLHPELRTEAGKLLRIRS